MASPTRRQALIVALLAATLALGGCSREDARRDERELGKAAYKAKQESEAAAARADRALRQAGHEARQGYNDAKHEDKKKDEPAR
ncbi:MAG TPA: hypothetical protein VN893_26630 [Bryobacteraceae bacterium]|jgi:uncharacterized lipoprotein NlpE involved in copper resistance|nr:hypothetical protein [Bryobacteraceae bacterium]